MADPLQAILSSVTGMSPGNMKTTGSVLGSLGDVIPQIGNATSGIVPAGMPASRPAVASSNPVPTAPTIAGPTSPPVIGSPTGQAPINMTPSMNPTGVPQLPGATPIPTSQPINGGDYNSVYGVDTGTAITNLLNSEGGGAASQTAEQIIQANAPNVAQGSANLNTALAASGISPSSSVSAIENANYMGQVQQQNLATEAQVGLTEQEMQTQLLEQLLPSQQQRQTDSSGWSIFGDILSGIGDIFAL